MFSIKYVIHYHLTHSGKQDTKDRHEWDGHVPVLAVSPVITVQVLSGHALEFRPRRIRKSPERPVDDLVGAVDCAVADHGFVVGKVNLNILRKNGFVEKQWNLLDSFNLLLLKGMWLFWVKTSWSWSWPGRSWRWRWRRRTRRRWASRRSFDQKVLKNRQWWKSKIFVQINLFGKIEPLFWKKLNDDFK